MMVREKLISKGLEGSKTTLSSSSLDSIARLVHSTEVISIIGNVYRISLFMIILGIENKILKKVK